MLLLSLVLIVIVLIPICVVFYIFKRINYIYPTCFIKNVRHFYAHKWKHRVRKYRKSIVILPFPSPSFHAGLTQNAMILPLKTEALDQHNWHPLIAPWKFGFSGSAPDLLNQNLHFNKISMWFLCILKFGKHYSTNLLSLPN